MNIDELRRIAAREEISLNFAAKDEMISMVLLQLQGVKDIILKGGTAINRVYTKKRRFSEDIDFDFVFRGTVKEALSQTQKIVEKIKSFAIAKPRIMNQTIRYDLQYFNPLQHKDTVRLEFRIVPSASHYSQKVVNPGFVPADAALLNVYNLEELLRQKIECIFTRKEGKDLFDLYYLLEQSSQPIPKTKKEKLLQCLNLEAAEIKAIANSLNHYIPRTIRPEWALFIEELREKVRRR